MQKVLLDTNVILDILLQRTTYFQNAVKIFERIDKGALQPYITATTITDIYYIARKEKGKEKTLEFISNLIEVVEVIGIDKTTIVNALKLALTDFEDAIQVAASQANDLTCIITRNKKDFPESSISILSPEEYLTNFPQ